MNKKSALGLVVALCFGAFLCGAVVSTVLNARGMSFVAPPTFTPPVFSFQKDLKLGDDNQDVRQLQILLNTGFGTHVAEAGVGSRGQESTYFGQLTRNAVVRFQLRNKLSATGAVDVVMRAKLNGLIPSLTPTTATATTTSTSTALFSGPLPLTKERLPRLYATRPQQIRRGESFTLVGAGFEAENIVHIGTNVFRNVLPLDSNNISFTIPTMSPFPNGTYEVWVENSKGTSRVVNRPVDLIISDNPQPAPVISSVSPVTVSDIETVTVFGTGFSPTNEVVSGFGTLKNVSSNGTQITFSPRSLLKPEVLGRVSAGTSLRIDFYVMNDNGTSNVFGTVNLKI